MKVSAHYRFFRVLSLAALLALGLASSAHADDSAINLTYAQEVLEDMSEFLADHKEFGFTAEVNYGDVTESGLRIHALDVIEVALKRPGKLWIDTRGEISSSRTWYDGRTFTLMTIDQGFYSQARVSGNVEAALDHMADKYGVLVPVVDFLTENPYEGLTQDLTAGGYVGRRMVNGVMCHHLAFAQGNVDWQVWIEDGKHPLPRKFVVTYKLEPGAPEVVTFFTNWDLNTKHIDRLFEFDPPASARQIEFLETEEE